jgi:hypothetical protein
MSLPTYIGQYTARLFKAAPGAVAANMAAATLRMESGAGPSRSVAVFISQQLIVCLTRLHYKPEPPGLADQRSV